MMTTTTQPRAFTLVEMMVAAVVGIIIISIAMGAWVQVELGEVSARRRAALAREAGFALRVMTEDLRQAGLGVPGGGHIQRACDAARCSPLYGTAPPARFYAPILVANATQLGMVGDVPRPNAQYNTFAPLSSFRAGRRTNLAFTSENSGLCVPRLSGPSCRTGDTSFFFPGESGCDTQASVLDRTCAWGMGRVQPGDRIQIVAGNRQWSHAAATSPLRMETEPAVFNLVALALDPPLDRGGGDTVWSNDAKSGAGPGGIVGAGWVTTLDRVFFLYDQRARTLSRVQCWGDPDPDHSGFPEAGASTVPPLAQLALVPSTSGAQVEKNQCTDPELLARFVDSVLFRTFDARGNSLPATLDSAAEKNAVRRVDVRLVLRVPGDERVRDVVHEAQASVLLSNLGPGGAP